MEESAARSCELQPLGPQKGRAVRSVSISRYIREFQKSGALINPNLKYSRDLVARRSKQWTPMFFETAIFHHARYARRPPPFRTSTPPGQHDLEQGRVPTEGLPATRSLEQRDCSPPPRAPRALYEPAFVMSW